MSVRIKCTACPEVDCLFQIAKNEDIIQKVEKAGYLIQHRRGQHAFYNQGISNAIHVLCNGLAGLEYGLSKRPQTLLFIGAGEILSSGGVFGLRHSASAQMWEGGQVLELKSTDFQNLANEHPELWSNLAQRRTRREQKIVEHLSLWIQLTVKERMAASLLVFLNQFGENHAFPNLRIRLASFAGVNTEQCVRVLSEFRRQGLIHIQRSQIAFKKPEILQKIAYARFA